MTVTICPTCNANSSFLLDWQYSGLDGSIFNYTAKFYCCTECGLVYVENINDKTLAHFYADECSYFEKSHFDISSPANIEKYTHYKNILLEHGLQDVAVTDIGCGRSGFLLWLNGNGWQSNLYGVDVDVRSIPNNCAGNGHYSVQLKQGGALALPYENDSQELLTYFHVLEHIRDIDTLLSEANRVLEPDGSILIEVPDAEHYAKQNVGSAFWIGIREHIYHFSANALIAALERHGFSITQVRRDMLPTPEFSYPSLIVLAKKTDQESNFECETGGDIAAFVRLSKQQLQNQANKIITLAGQHSQLTFWGCSSELLSLLPMLGTLNYSLCDASPIKQKSKYFDQEIKDPSQIEPEGLLVVAPYLYSDIIERAAIQIGWQQQSIYKLT